MAVDFAVPLITNVKNAKMLAEALIRKLPLDVSSLDSKSSHDTHIFPGLVNVAAFVPRLATQGSGDLPAALEGAVRGGFTTSVVLPVGDGDAITSRATLDLARANIATSAHCNFALGIAATSTNAELLDEETQAEVKSLFVPGSMALSSISAHFGTWSVDKPIVTDAKGSELASILLLASLNGRSVHVTNVRTKDDLMLISLSKGKGLNVTCDVSVYSLFYSRDAFEGTEALPTAEDQKALWSQLNAIDAFSVGPTPYRLAQDAKADGSAFSGVEEALPLLLTAVTQGKLTLDDIRKRLHDNPVTIFGIPEQSQTTVEVVIGRPAPYKNRTSTWSPLESKLISAFVHRVVVHGQTVYLDGALSAQPQGRDISATVVHPSTSSAIAPSASQTVKEPTVEHIVAPAVSATGALAPASLQAFPQQAISSLPHLQIYPAFHRRHILSVKQFAQRDIHNLFTLAHEMRLQVERNGTLDILKGKVLCTAFYEPSTRTSASFDAAMKRCGGQVVQIHADMSSVKKGETLADTVRTLACYGDAIVLRHPDVGSAQLAAKYSSVPVINAGDGVGEHPTQVCFRSS
jgi:carbamoyl-phosphate synthase/aspartate carbamoyltransferase